MVMEGGRDRERDDGGRDREHGDGGREGQGTW